MKLPPGMDAANYRDLGHGWSIDTSRGEVYFSTAGSRYPRRIAGVDAASFSTLEAGYARDARTLYHNGKVIRGTTPEGFERLGHYARTRQVVMYHGRKVEGADPGSFRALEEYRGRDDAQVFDRGFPEPKPAFSIGGYGVRLKRTGSGAGAFGGLLLIVILLSGAFVWLFEKITGRGKAEEAPTRDRTRDRENLKQIATAIAGGNARTAKQVLRALDPESEADDDAAAAYLGRIDHRSESDETLEQVEPMLRRLQIRDFDWSFIDILEEHGDGAELRNCNLLSLLRDRLNERGLTLAHLDFGDDSFGFAVMSIEDFGPIDGLDAGTVKVRADFGADEAYQTGKRILDAHGVRG